MLCLWGLVSVPLCFAGTVIGRGMSAAKPNPKANTNANIPIRTVVPK